MLFSLFADEPILCYQRNSFFPLAEEKRVSIDSDHFDCVQTFHMLVLLYACLTLYLNPVLQIKDDRVIRRLFEEVNILICIFFTKL